MVSLYQEIITHHWTAEERYDVTSCMILTTVHLTFDNGTSQIRMRTDVGDIYIFFHKFEADKTTRQLVFYSLLLV